MIIFAWLMCLKHKWLCCIHAGVVVIKLVLWHASNYGWSFTYAQSPPVIIYVFALNRLQHHGAFIAVFTGPLKVYAGIV